MMRYIEIWKRLLWKEARESGLVMVIPITAPLSAYWAPDDIRSFMWLLSLFVAMLSVTMWATLKAQQKGAKRGEWLQLPMSPRIDWLASFILPMMIACVIGAWFGYWESSSTLPAFNLSRDAMASAVHGDMFLGALSMMAGFAVCYMTAVAFSLPLAIVMSIAWVAPGFLLANALSGPFRDSNYPLIAFLIRGIAGAGAASILFPALSRRKSNKAARAWAAALILVMPLAPVIRPFYDEITFMTNTHMGNTHFEYFSQMDAYSPDRNLSITALPESTRATKVLLLTDNKHGITRRKSFDADILVASIINDGTAYLAQQRPGDSAVNIIRWNANTNLVSTMMAFPAGKNAFWGPRLPGLSPAGRYLTMITPSQIGDGNDLWALDLQRKVSRIVAPNLYISIRSSYSGDRVCFSYADGGLLVDLRNMTASPLDLPSLPRR